MEEETTSMNKAMKKTGFDTKGGKLPVLPGRPSLNSVASSHYPSISVHLEYKHISQPKELGLDTIRNTPYIDHTSSTNTGRATR